MSAPETRTYTVGGESQRSWLAALVNTLAPGWRVIIKPPGRSLDQNAKAHALFQDIAKAKPEWNGIAMDAERRTTAGRCAWCRIWKGAASCSSARARRR